MIVPKIIHQTWRTLDLPPQISGCVESFRRFNPEWQHVFYLDRDWRNLGKECSFFDWEAFQRIPSSIQRADAFRLIALVQEGGVYADVDIECLQPLDHLFRDALQLGLISSDTEVILTRDHPFHERQFYGGAEILMNDFMIAKPGARALAFMLSQLEERIMKEGIRANKVLDTTGPLALTKAVREFGGVDAAKVAVLPVEWIHPLPDMTLSFPEREEFCEKIRNRSWNNGSAYVAHYWWHSYWAGGTMLDLFPEDLPLVPSIGA